MEEISASNAIPSGLMLMMILGKAWREKLLKDKKEVKKEVSVEVVEMITVVVEAGLEVLLRAVVEVAGVETIEGRVLQEEMLGVVKAGVVTMVVLAQSLLEENLGEEEQEEVEVLDLLVEVLGQEVMIGIAQDQLVEEEAEEEVGVIREKMETHIEEAEQNPTEVDGVKNLSENKHLVLQSQTAIGIAMVVELPNLGQLKKNHLSKEAGETK